jgi:hypothetical protein
VAAGIRKEVADHLPDSPVFLKADQTVCMGPKVRGILRRSPLTRLNTRKLVPRLAGDLTSATSRTTGRVDEKIFTTHTLIPSLLGNIHHESLGLGDSGVRIAD